MTNKRLARKAAIAGIGTAAAALYLSRLFCTKLDTSTEKAIYNGFEILNNKTKALAITAHPDDLEIFMAGTIKLLNDRGTKIHLLDVTDGEKGRFRKNLAETRMKEQKRAAAILGADEVHFLHLPDRHLKGLDNLEEELENEINRIEPDIIFTFDYKLPFRAIKHPDHIAVGKAVSNIMKRMDNDKISLVYYATRQPNATVDISDAIGNKIDAIKMHRSQLRFGPKPYECITRTFAKYNSLKTYGELAEVFRVESEK